MRTRLLIAAGVADVLWAEGDLLGRICAPLGIPLGTPPMRLRYDLHWVETPPPVWIPTRAERR